MAESTQATVSKTDSILRWVLGIVASVAAALSTASIGAVMSMRDSIKTMEAQMPLRDQLEEQRQQFRDQQIEQMRLGMQITNSEIDNLEQRVRDLEREP